MKIDTVHLCAYTNDTEHYCQRMMTENVNIMKCCDDVFQYAIIVLPAYNCVGWGQKWNSSIKANIHQDSFELWHLLIQYWSLSTNNLIGFTGKLSNPKKI